jgi:hypothetical protein
MPSTFTAVSSPRVPVVVVSPVNWLVRPVTDFPRPLTVDWTVPTAPSLGFERPWMREV